MEFNLTLLFLIPVGLGAGAAYAFFLRPLWRASVERCRTLDEDEAREKALKEQAERELREELQAGDRPQ